MDSNRARQAARERYAAQRTAFDATTDAYTSIRHAHPLRATSYDETTPQTRSLSFASIEFKADVERAVTAAIGNHPELVTAFHQLVDGYSIPTKAEHQLHRLCGQVFITRGLIPRHYFAPMKRRPK